MPSPVGHALAGLAIGWSAEAIVGPRPTAAAATPAANVLRALSGYPALGVVLALAPDVDLLAGSHRTISHSIGGAVLVGLGAWLAVRLTGRRAAALGLVCAAAFGSHVLLDWLGQDTSAPYGLTALWPLSSEYVSSGADLFPAVSRRYWNPGQFLQVNLRAVWWELLLLGPVTLAARLARDAGKRRRGPGTVPSGPRPPVPGP